MLVCVIPNQMRMILKVQGLSSRRFYVDIECHAVGGPRECFSEVVTESCSHQSNKHCHFGPGCFVAPLGHVVFGRGAREPYSLLHANLKTEKVKLARIHVFEQQMEHCLGHYLIRKLRFPPFF